MARRPGITRKRPSEALRDAGGHQTPEIPENPASDEIIPVPDPIQGEIIPPPSQQPELTLGEVYQKSNNDADRFAADTPVAAFSDIPFPGQEPDPSDRMVPPAPVPQRQPITTAAPAEGSQRAAAPENVTRVRSDHVPPRPAAVPGDGGPDGGLRYVDLHAGASVKRWLQRIVVLDAYQFDGHVQTAPQWVDRNWLMFSDAAKNEVGVGTVLNVPGIGDCRVGDYIVLQDVLEEDGARVSKVEIYKRQDFERLFISTDAGAV